MPDRCVIDSPFGHLLLEADAAGLTRLVPSDAPLSPAAAPLLCEAAHELAEYFAGTRRVFDLPLRPSGTPFQQRAWQALCAIPYGQTRTYAQQAAILGSPKAARAVGGANHHNPIMIIIPCHRVIGTDGSLTGYAGGLAMKEWLLAHERKSASDKT